MAPPDGAAVLVGIVPGVPDDLPRVTVLLPVLNEEQHIDACLLSLSAQDYAGPMSIVVADGGSRDGTRARLEAWAGRLDLIIVDNPHRRQAHGLNLAATRATGTILVRADAHTEYAPDYVSRCVAALHDVPGGAVGGPMRPEGVGVFGRAVAAAMRSRLTVGPGRFHRTDVAGDSDTVYLGAFRPADFDALGGFRAFPSGSGEDADFYFRMRRSGRRVVLDPSIRSRYRPRERPGALFRQHLRYGWVKGEMLWVNRAFPSWRPLAPAGLVAALIAGVIVGFAGWWWPLVITMAAWLAILVAAAARSPRLAGPFVLAAILMHLGYGLGFWWGVVRGPGPVRHLR